MKNDDFFQDLVHSSMTSERSKIEFGENRHKPVKWRKKIIINLFTKDKNSDVFQLIDRTAINFSQKLEMIPDLSASISSSNAGNLLVLFADSSIAKVTREYELFKPISDFNKLVAESDFCLTRLYIDENENVISARIFVPETKTGESLEMCILEELFNSTGLTGDPVGYGAFLDKWPPNRNEEGQPELSPAHIAMLQLYYSPEFRDIQTPLKAKSLARALCSN